MPLIFFIIFFTLRCHQVERGSPKSCFLFLGEVLCDVNWLSVLSDHFQTSPASTLYPSCPDTLKESHAMLVYLLYMLVFLAKEEQIVSQPVRWRGSKIKFHISVRQSSFYIYIFFHLQDSPLLSLLVQATSLPWYQLDLSSYQGVLDYVSTHYPPSLLLSSDSASQLLLKSVRSAAGLHPRATELPHRVRCTLGDFSCHKSSFCRQMQD